MNDCRCSTKPSILLNPKRLLHPCIHMFHIIIIINKLTIAALMAVRKRDSADPSSGTSGKEKGVASGDDGDEDDAEISSDAAAGAGGAGLGEGAGAGGAETGAGAGEAFAGFASFAGELDAFPVAEGEEAPSATDCSFFLSAVGLGVLAGEEAAGVSLSPPKATISSSMRMSSATVRRARSTLPTRP